MNKMQSSGQESEQSDYQNYQIIKSRNRIFEMYMYNMYNMSD